MVDVESNASGTPNCSCYRQGHNLHWIPVLRVWRDEPRYEMTIKANENDSFQITVNGKTATWYNHTPSRVRQIIGKAPADAWRFVGDTGAVQLLTRDGHGWLYFAKKPVNNCEKSLCMCR